MKIFSLNENSKYLASRLQCSSFLHENSKYLASRLQCSSFLQVFTGVFI